MKHDQREEAPSQFYTGLVAELYEPLASERARADDYIPFLERSGTPALELACGSGLPLMELVERGFQVHGLDSSQDMLDRCHARAAARGLDVTLHLGEMQSFSLSHRYWSIFLAGASFTLLTTDEDAASALERIYAHLDPGGSVLIPLEIVDLRATRKALGRFREVTTAAGDRSAWAWWRSTRANKNGHCATAFATSASLRLVGPRSWSAGGRSGGGRKSNFGRCSFPPASAR